MRLRALRRSILDHEQSSGKRDLVARRNFNHKLHSLRGGGPVDIKKLLTHKGSIEGRFLLRTTDSRAILTRDGLTETLKDESPDVIQCNLFYFKLLQTIIGIRRRVNKMSKSGKETVINDETLCDGKCKKLKSKHKHTCVNNEGECVKTTSKKKCKGGVYCDNTTEYKYAKEVFLTDFIDALLLKKNKDITRPTLFKQDIQELATRIKASEPSFSELDDSLIPEISDKAYSFLRKYKNLTPQEKIEGQSLPPEVQKQLRLEIESRNLSRSS